MQSENEFWQTKLLWFGILSSLWYAFINIYVPLQYEGYSMSSLTVSELSAIGAPTRSIWVPLAIPYVVLFACFGIGVWRSAAVDRRLRTIGAIVIAYAAFNIYWPPMHMRGAEPTLTDALHIAWASVTILMMITMMVYGAVLFKGNFRTYTIVSIVLHLVFGVLTSLEAPKIAINGSTPTIGIWERINIAVFMIWVVAFALVLLRKQNPKGSFATY